MAGAERIGTDRDDYRLCFGPSNVAIWSVSLAVEACDGPSAVQRAQEAKIAVGTPRERVGHHLIDVGRAWLLQGDRDRSLAALRQAYDISATQT